ncbi:MAG: hypothetical protein OXJ64_11065 [Boseongicola sp.]|nr:hypothetical protein [Boseongicola sp.]
MQELFGTAWHGGAATHFRETSVDAVDLGFIHSLPWATSGEKDGS